MAFCNKCGANLAPDSKFCNKCGTPQNGPQAAVSSTAPATGGGNALKVVLIVVGVIIVLGIIGIATLAIVGIHIAKNAHVTQNGNQVKVETPFGSVETSKDPEKAARDLGVDIYPEAKVDPNGAAVVTMGKMHTVTVNFDSSDPPEKVCSFYRSKFPNASVSNSGENRCTIVSKDSKNIVTINVESSGDGSKFHIATVTQ